MKKWSDGCGDHSCLIKSPEQDGKMRTNGGCRCFKGVGNSSLKGIRHLAKLVDEANVENQKLCLENLSLLSQLSELSYKVNSSIEPLLESKVNVVKKLGQSLKKDIFGCQGCEQCKCKK